MYSSLVAGLGIWALIKSKLVTDDVISTGCFSFVIVRTNKLISKIVRCYWMTLKTV